MHLPGRFILVGAVGLLLLSSLLLGAFGIFALPGLSDFLADVTGIRQSLKVLVDPTTGKIPLRLLPTGSGSGLDADTLDARHGSAFALLDELDAARSALEIQIGSLVRAPTIDLSAFLKKTEAATDSAKLGGQAPGFYQNAGNLSSGTVADLRLSANVTLLDLAQTFSAGKTFASGLTVSSGALSFPTSSIADTALSSNVALLGGSQTFSGAKTFSVGITAPTTGNTINGLVVSSGNATLANLTSSTGSLTSTVADGATAVGFTLTTSTTYTTVGAKLLSIKNNGSEKLFLDKDGSLTVNGNLVATGTIQGTQLISTVLTGTAPLVVSSTTQVTNLNANFVQGFQASDLYSVPQPNLIPDSDFSRRTKWMTFMPEVFADTSGITVVTGSAPSAASNILTFGSLAQQVKEGLSTWRDIRTSAQFQFTGDATYTDRLAIRYVDAGNYVGLYLNSGSGGVRLHKVIAGVSTDLGTLFTITPTLNNWYWFEIEAQGTTIIGKFYSSGASPVAKSSATLLNTQTATVSDAAVAVGQIMFESSHGTNPAKWGGLATGDGGVYVEGWGPESWNIAHEGTKGGQAFGFDEAADSGPIEKQWAMRVYIPATSRALSIDAMTPDGSVRASTTYTHSIYVKTSGKGGTGDLVRSIFGRYDSPGAAAQGTSQVTDSGETSWTRKTVTATTEAGTRRAQDWIRVNAGLTATGTVFFLLPQLEQGSAATPWRNAPEDFAPLTWVLPVTHQTDQTTTSTGGVELEPRDLAANVFLPWDATVEMAADVHWNSSLATGVNVLDFYMDGVLQRPSGTHNLGHIPGTAAFGEKFSGRWKFGVATGKHRFALFFRTGGTETLKLINAEKLNLLTVTAVKGK